MYVYMFSGCQTDTILSGDNEDLQARYAQLEARYAQLEAHYAQLEAKMVKLEKDRGCMRKQLLVYEHLKVGKDNLTRFYTGFLTYHSFKS